MKRLIAIGASNFGNDEIFSVRTGKAERSYMASLAVPDLDGFAAEVWSSNLLEKTPPALGHALIGLRAGPDHLTWNRDSVIGPETVCLSSSAFKDQARLPSAYTEDGEKVSPPLAWSDVPEDAKTLVLVIEDADSPTPLPIIHTLAARPASGSGQIASGDLTRGGGEWVLGKNSFGKLGYLPPDPPTGHGPHHYIFQLFALSSTPVLIEGWG